MPYFPLKYIGSGPECYREGDNVAAWALSMFSNYGKTLLLLKDTS